MNRLHRWVGMITLLVGVTVGLAGCGQQAVAPSSATAQQADLEALVDRPYQSGNSAIVKINHNRSTLTPQKWQSNHVIYQQLDHLNRTSQANTAYLENRNIGGRGLRERQVVRPTGWHQKFVNGEPILNRGHLIAYSISKGITPSGTYNPNDLAGDQNNPRNLFTQTAFANQELQTIYEGQVRNALYHDKRVIYLAQPLFKGNELMARGIHLQAIATDGSLNFNVFIYNVQPDVQFDYATGRSTIDRSMQVPQPAGAPQY